MVIRRLDGQALYASLGTGNDGTQHLFLNAASEIIPIEASISPNVGSVRLLLYYILH